MVWQDVVFSAGGIVLIVALFPTLRAEEKPAVSTALLTGGVLCAFATAFITLALWLSAATQLITASVWFILAWQASRRRDGVHKAPDMA